MNNFGKFKRMFFGINSTRTLHITPCVCLILNASGPSIHLSFVIIHVWIGYDYKRK
jgi:hypothetical protein